jgi:DNA-binding MarR family transcriptional regulator
VGNRAADDIDEVGADLRRAVVRLYSRFRSERVEGEVADAALLVLIVLLKQDQLSLSDLAEAAKVTLGSMSQTVRRLELNGRLAELSAAERADIARVSAVLLRIADS